MVNRNQSWQIKFRLLWGPWQTWFVRCIGMVIATCSRRFIFGKKEFESIPIKFEYVIEIYICNRNIKNKYIYLPENDGGAAKETLLARPRFAGVADALLTESKNTLLARPRFAGTT